MTTAFRPETRTPGVPSFNPSVLDALPPEFRHGVKTPFTFGADFLPLAASATTSVDVGLQANAYFVLLAQSRLVTEVDNVTLVALPPMTVQIVDTGASRNFQNRAIHLENWFGTAQDPYLYTWPVIIGPSSTLTITVANLIATARQVRLAFHGFQVWGARR